MQSRHLAKGSRLPPAIKGKLRLFSMRFCPYAQRVHLILDAKKIPYDTVYINLSNKPEWFLDKFPSGTVPAIETENGELLHESLIVSDYLEDKYSQNPMYPQDPYKKAHDRILIDNFNKVIKNMYKVFLNNGKDCLEEYLDIIFEGLEIFENELLSRRSQFFGGKSPGMLDYMIWPWCERADLLKLFGNQFAHHKDRFKRLMEWRTLMLEDPAVKCSYLDTESHTKYLQSRRAGFPDYDLLLSQL